MTVAAAATVSLPTPAHAVCSVFARHPCAPTVCSVFRRRPCVPEVEYWIGQDLRLTVSSRAVEDDEFANGERHDGLNSLRDLFAALRACWVPPSRDVARQGMQMSVRLSFKRTGEMVGPPRLTYVSRDAPQEARDIYREAVMAALDRCTPLPLTKGLGGAIAGRPIAIRFVEDRT